MGCDIHLIVQVKNKDKWTEVEPPEDYDIGKYYSEDEWYPWRSYYDFAALANVRNHDGKITPILPDPYTRGLPPDMEEVEPSNWYGEWYPHNGYYGDHSFSWLTLAELAVYDGAPSGQLYTTLVPALIGLAIERGIKFSDVRIVFGFDS